MHMGRGLYGLHVTGGARRWPSGGREAGYRPGVSLTARTADWSVTAPDSHPSTGPGAPITAVSHLSLTDRPDGLRWRPVSFGMLTGALCIFMRLH